MYHCQWWQLEEELFGMAKSKINIEHVRSETPRRLSDNVK